MHTDTLPLTHLYPPPPTLYTQPILSPRGTGQHPQNSNQTFTKQIKPRTVFRPNCVFNIPLKRHDERTFSTDKCQSGFRTNHSTETALLKILNDIRCNLDNHKLTVLVLLDLTAAFDTVDHHILSNRLRNVAEYCPNSLTHERGFNPAAIQREALGGELTILLLLTLGEPQ